MNKSPADVLEEAADLLLIRGVNRDGTYGEEGGPRCALGAIGEVIGRHNGCNTAMSRALILHLWASGDRGVISYWNDETEDDFEVIDTLRLVAKDLRNAAVSS